MGDYIERMAALNVNFKIPTRFCESKLTTARKAVQEYANEIAKIPAADVRPVVRARWVNLTPPEFRTDEESVFWMCSECRNAAVFLAEDLPYNFCPNCGADMKGEQDV